MSQRALKASEFGKILIKKAIKRKGWNLEDNRWLIEASKILEPNQDWDQLATNDIYASYVSFATWKRFREARQPIRKETFKAFCQVLDLNSKEVVDNGCHVSQVPPISYFYGRNQELAHLTQCMIKERYRLIAIYGVGGIGKTALGYQLIENIANRYDYFIMRSLADAPSLTEVVATLPKIKISSLSHNNENYLSSLIQYLCQHRCLLILDDWEAIIGTNERNYKEYSHFLQRVAQERHKSSLLLLSREKPQELELLSDRFVYFHKLRGLNCEEAKIILKQEGLTGTDHQLEEFSRRYSNPWILKRVARQVKAVFDGELSFFINNVSDSTFFNDQIATFIDNQFRELSSEEVNIMYWLAIRRNQALWKNLQNDTINYLSPTVLFEKLHCLIERRSLVEKNRNYGKIFYVLDPVILKYLTTRFVNQNCEEIKEIINHQTIKGSELLISHSFITENNQDEQLTQEQMRRIVRPIQNYLQAFFHGKQQANQKLRTILSLLQDRQDIGYARQNIELLIS
ncbi:MAG: NB-ARC domain-containing protein [Calothrix sp. MO_167.B12]|nr:NB-ARC domain-containing protein [Calothrix sp. MO_167.B12]